MSSSKDTSAVVEHFVEAVFPPNNSEDVLEVMSTIHQRQITVFYKNSRRKKKKSRTLRSCTLLSIQKALYKDYEPLHELWKDYISELLGSQCDTKSVQDVLLKADLHGAMILVVHCKCVSINNLCGIIVLESKNIFQLLTASNKLVKIPKKNSIFQIIFLNYRITIFGDQFCIKPGFRLTKKFLKYLPVLDLI